MMACDLPKGYRLGASLVILCLALTTSASPHRGRDHDDSSRDRRQNCRDGNLWFKPNGECYKRGVQGPCGTNMIIAEHPKHQQQGRCVCIKVVNCQYWPFAHFEEQNSCYPLYDRGPCGESEWLVPLHQRRRNGPKEIWQRQEQSKEDFIKGKCVTRECPPSNQLYLMFSAYGECYQVGSQGICERQEERMYYGKGSVYPHCSKNVIQAPNCNPIVGGAQSGSQGSGYGGQGTAPGYGGVPPLVPEYNGQGPGYGGAPSQVPDHNGQAPGYGGAPSQVPEYNGQAPGYGGALSQVPEYNGQAPGYGGAPSQVPEYGAPGPGYGGASPSVAELGGAAPSYGTLEAQPEPIQSPPVLEAIQTGYRTISATAEPLPVLEPALPSSGYLSQSTVSPVFMDTRVLGKTNTLACPSGQVQGPSGCAKKAII